MSYRGELICFHPYSSWGLFIKEAHVPLYFIEHYIQYASSKHLERSSCCKSHFDQNRFGVQPNKKVAKQLYHVKKDNHKDKRSNLNETIEKPFTLLKDLTIHGKDIRG